MSKHSTLARRAAAALVRGTAAWLERTSRGQWGRAMRAELDHIDSDYEALRWACGCALAAITLRRTDMDMGTLRVSRFVLALEMALCFVPLTFGWFDVMFGMSGVAWLDGPTIDLYVGTSAGVAMLAKMLAGAVIGLLGPVGLVVAMRNIVLGRALRRGLVSAALVVGPILLAAVYVVANLASGTELSIEWGGFYVLFAVLPLAGAVHLIHLGGAQPARTLSAA
jgi:hypothetical protein